MSKTDDMATRLEDLERVVCLRLTQVDGPKIPPLVLVSVSGGADSTFLLYFFHRIASSLPIQLHVMHINHGQRVDSYLDAQFVEAMCSNLGLPFHLSTLATEELRTAEDCNRQAAMRHLRYQRLMKKSLSLAEEGQIPIIATGHHAHDQAETLLMNLVRGTGMHGLRGIQEWQTWTVADSEHPGGIHRQIHLYRPLLNWDRPSIESLLTQWGVAWRDDPSNRDTRYVRNRIRHEVLPVLESLNPRFVSNLAQRNRDWTAVIDNIQDLHDKNLRRIVVGIHPTSGQPLGMTWDLDLFLSLPTWQKNGFLHTVFQKLRPSMAGISTARLENLAKALATINRSGGPWPWFQDLAWSSWYRPDPDLFSLSPTRLLISLHLTGVMPFVLDHPSLPADSPHGKTIRIRDTDGHSVLPVEQPAGNWRLILRETTARGLPAHLPVSNQPWSVLLDLDRLESAGEFLRLAPPKVHAYMQPLGMATGRKRLDRLLRDRRIHKSLHAVWPVLYANRDTVVWMCGLHLDRRFALHSGSHRIVEIRWSKSSV